jgi:hypothetical protein
LDGGADDRDQLRLGGRLSINHWTLEVRDDAVFVDMQVSSTKCAELDEAASSLPFDKLRAHPWAQGASLGSGRSLGSGAHLLGLGNISVAQSSIS